MRVDQLRIALLLLVAWAHPTVASFLPSFFHSTELVQTQEAFQRDLNEETASPTESPAPSPSPSKEPSATPTITPKPTDAPSVSPTESPAPSPSPSKIPSLQPSSFPSAPPSRSPTGRPSFLPSSLPSSVPSSEPSHRPSLLPSLSPSYGPSSFPSVGPTDVPSSVPSSSPSSRPSTTPSFTPTLTPTTTANPSSTPSTSPTTTSVPTSLPTEFPTFSMFPSMSPSTSPSDVPSTTPSISPSALPSMKPSFVPSTSPTFQMSASATFVLKLIGLNRSLDANERGVVEDGCEEIVSNNGHLVDGRLSNIVASVLPQTGNGGQRFLQSTTASNNTVSRSISVSVDADYYGNDQNFDLRDTFSSLLDGSNQDLIDIWIGLRDQQLGGIGENIFKSIGTSNSPASSIVGDSFVNTGADNSGLGGGAYAGLILLSVFAVTLAIAVSVMKLRQFHQSGRGAQEQIVITPRDIADIEASVNVDKLDGDSSEGSPAPPLNSKARVLDIRETHGSSSNYAVATNSDLGIGCWNPVACGPADTQSSAGRQPEMKQQYSLEAGSYFYAHDNSQSSSQTPKRERDGSPTPNRNKSWRPQRSPSPKRTRFSENAGDRRSSGNWLMNNIRSPRLKNVSKHDAPQSGPMGDVAARRAAYEPQLEPPTLSHSRSGGDPAGTFSRSGSRLSSVPIKDRISQFEKLSEAGANDVDPRAATLLGRLGANSYGDGKPSGLSSARALLSNVVSGVAAVASPLRGNISQVKEKPMQPPQDLVGHPGIYHVLAPPGAVGIIVDTSLEGPAVHSLKSTSPMLGLISPGDLIVALDNEDTRDMTAATLTRLMAQKSTQSQRKITLLTVEQSV